MVKSFVDSRGLGLERGLELMVMSFMVVKGVGWRVG